MQLIKLLIPILFIIGISSCTEPFMPKTAEHDYSIFIEGLVTNDPEIPPMVRMSRSIPIRTEDDENAIQRPDYIDGAEVYLKCDDGTEYRMQRGWERGTYRIVDQSFTGETGKSYKLIIYSEGEVFESDFELLRESPAIDSISYKVKEKKLTDVSEIVTGYNFHVSTHEDTPGPSYYRWLLDATFYYSVPLNAHFIWDGRELVPGSNNLVKYCWKSKNITGIFAAGTEDLVKNSIIEATLNFESQYGDELSKKYSLHVRQLTISKESYYFWEDLDKLINQTGGLYETQPFRLSGNIKCTSNSDINIAGVFEVAGVSEGRGFFWRPHEFPIFTYICLPDTVGTEFYPFDLLEEGAYVIYDDEIDAYFTSTFYCFDCTTRGGTTERPAFWE